MSQTEYNGKTYCLDEKWKNQKDCAFSEVSTLTGKCFWKLPDGRCKLDINSKNLCDYLKNGEV